MCLPTSLSVRYACPSSRLDAAVCARSSRVKAIRSYMFGSWHFHEMSPRYSKQMFLAGEPLTQLTQHLRKRGNAGGVRRPSDSSIFARARNGHFNSRKSSFAKLRIFHLDRTICCRQRKDCQACANCKNNCVTVEGTGFWKHLLRAWWHQLAGGPYLKLFACWEALVTRQLSFSTSTQQLLAGLASGSNFFFIFILVIQNFILIFEFRVVT